MRTEMLGNIDPESLLWALVDSTGEAIIITDPEGTIRFWNPSTELILGYSEAEALGRHISFIVPPEGMDQENDLMARVLSGQTVRLSEVRRLRKDRGIAEVVLSATAVRNREGSVVGVARVAREMTQLRAAERQNAYYSAIVDSTDDAVVAKNFDGIVTAWNPGAERLFGYSAKEAIGNHISLIIPADRLAEERSIMEALRAGQRIDHFETVRRHKSGREIDVSITLSPIFDRHKRMIGGSKIARDITDRKRVERQLQEAARRKDEFMANMSHELRTPMNAIVGLSDLLSLSKPLSDRQKKFVATLKISSDNLLALINDLLDFSKVEQGEMRLEEVEFSLPEAVDRALAPLAIKAEEKNLELRVNYLNAVRKYFVGDPLRFQQVITNLVSNAVKFTERGSIDVSISAAASPSPEVTTLVIEVADTGIGIPEEARASIFDKFFQAETSITRKYGGSGLGLSIVRAIVGKMGGTVAVESQVSVGSTFTVRLPLRHSSNAETIEVKPAASQPPRSGGARVLIVEDYEPNALVAAAMLDACGYAHETATSGREALSIFQRGGFDAVLMDIQMPGLDGCETARRIRAMEREGNLPETPIMAVTAHALDGDKAQCVGAGMNDFLAKPYTLDALSAKLSKIVPKHA